MQHARLGKTGPTVSRICLGTMTYGSSAWRDWVLDESASRPFIRRALEAGINFFDTANVYSQGASEEVLGRALKDFAGGRDKVVVATKVFFPMGPGPDDRGLSRKHILSAIDASLRRLGMDYVDLYQIHRFDLAVPMEETIAALDEVVRAGKARHIGASSMHARQFADYLQTADKMGMARFISMQNFYNLVYREEEHEMLPLAQAQGVGVIPWSPLSRGFLGRSRQANLDSETVRAKSDHVHDLRHGEADYAILDKVAQIAAAHDATNAQVALAWLLHQPAVSAPIIGASKMNHLEDAIKAVEIRLSGDELAALAAPYQPKPVIGHI